MVHRTYDCIWMDAAKGNTPVFEVYFDLRHSGSVFIRTVGNAYLKRTPAPCKHQRRAFRRIGRRTEFFTYAASARLSLRATWELSLSFQNASSRRLVWIQRKAKMFSAPDSPQNIPDCLHREPRGEQNRTICSRGVLECPGPVFGCPGRCPGMDRASRNFAAMFISDSIPVRSRTVFGHHWNGVRDGPERCPRWAVIKDRE